MPFSNNFWMIQKLMSFSIGAKLNSWTTDQYEQLFHGRANDNNKVYHKVGQHKFEIENKKILYPQINMNIFPWKGKLLGVA